jgi:Pyruvate/2-oxoacid:ferredoxin oxidoreductase gamma subunit
LLGALSTLLNLSDEAWRETLPARLPAKYLEANLRAFETGRELVAERAP